MVRGLAVVEAILGGKRVRHGESGWLQWDDALGKFRREDSTEWRPSSGQLLADDWTIEADRPLTFAEAHARMRKGAVVELPMENGGILQYRIRGGSYEMREGDAEGAWSAWDESMVGLDCVEATTWRVAGEGASEGDRPTMHEVVSCLVNTTQVSWAWPLDTVIAELYRRWPAMFRKESADDAE